MNREIKFRQLSFDKWHYWGFIDGAFIGPANLSPSYQYTGFKDKDGKPIYEGDILTGGRIVKWDKDGQWIVSDKDWEIDPLWRWTKVAGIVGNIFEKQGVLPE